MEIRAKFVSHCTICGMQICTGQLIEFRRGQKATHAGCDSFVAALEAAKSEVLRLFRDGCAAETCPCPGTCNKEHYLALGRR